MKYKGLGLLLVVFCIMLLFNIFTPLLNDDYFIAFVWPVGGSINALPENAKRITSFLEIFESLKSYYVTWGGRIPGQTFMIFFLWQGKQYFNFINALMFIVLIAEIYWLSHEGKVSLVFDLSVVFWIFFSLWAFNIAFTESFLWLSGSCEYLWLMVVLLAFLTPYVQNYYDESLLKQESLMLNASTFLLGLVAGCSRETLICWFIPILCYWLYSCKIKGNLQCWKITGFIGLCIGYSVLLFAPGNASRLKILSSIMNTNIFLNKNLLIYKLIEMGFILFFHFFLWYFLFNFFYKHKKWIKKNQERVEKYTRLIKLSTLIAFCSGISAFFIPSRAIRISFVSLVFLLIAVATVFTMREREKICLFNKSARALLKKIGYFYLILTISVSLAGNYTNWCFWNEVIMQLKSPASSVADVVRIEVPPPLTENNRLWFFGSGLVHLTGLPVYENGPLNSTISKYYGVKRIEVIKLVDNR